MKKDYRVNKEKLELFLNLTDEKKRNIKNEIDSWPDWKKEGANILYKVKLR